MMASLCPDDIPVLCRCLRRGYATRPRQPALGTWEPPLKPPTGGGLFLRSVRVRLRAPPAWSPWQHRWRTHSPLRVGERRASAARSTARCGAALEQTGGAGVRFPCLHVLTAEPTTVIYSRDISTR